jgi:hypothetical protein
MMEYKVVQKHQLNGIGYNTLEFEVNMSMHHDGWKPKGGVSYTERDGYIQAMVRNLPLPSLPLPSLPQERSSAVVGSSSDSGGSSRKKSKRRLRKTQYRSKRNNQKSRKSRKL